MSQRFSFATKLADVGQNLYCYPKETCNNLQQLAEFTNQRSEYQQTKIKSEQLPLLISKSENGTNLNLLKENFNLLH